jgi:hypothetical protein
LLVRLQLGEWTFPFDDPWIHQVYARNLAENGQYAFNVGETSTGSSAPLWTLLLVPAYWLRLPPTLWALFLGLLSLGVLGAVVWAWSSRRFEAPLPLLLTVATVLSPQVAWAGVEGMETALVAALALFILSRQDGPGWKAATCAFIDGLLNGLLLWLRPEGPLLTLFVLWQRRREGWRHLSAFGAGFAVLAGPYVGFHLALGGRPLPQTVYAKVAYYGQAPTLSSIGGFVRDLLLAFAPGIMPLVVLLLPFSLWRMSKRRDWPWGPGLAWAGLTTLLAALRMPAVLHFGRHFVPILAPIILASGETLRHIRPRHRQALLLLAGCLLLIGVYIGASFFTPACQLILDTQVEMGDWIATELPPDIPVATHDVGAIGYFGEHPVVDTLALITPDLTPVVAERDTDALLAYLQQHDVQYLATLDDVYSEIQELEGVQHVIKVGRMWLLRLPQSTP